jgi:cell division protein FtsQ
VTAPRPQSGPALGDGGAGQPGASRYGVGSGGVGPGGAGPGDAGQAGAGQAGVGRRAGGRRGSVRGPDGARRPLNPWKAGFVLLALAGIVAAVAWALLGSRFLVVRSVTVTGLHRVSRPQVLAAAGIPLGLPLIRVNTTAVAHRIDAITQVESSRVSRNWPDGIVISVTERTPALAVRDGRRYNLIDRFGVVVVSAAQRPKQLPLFLPSGPIRGNPAVEAAAAVTRELPAALSQRLTSVTAPAPDDVRLSLTGGVTVVWGSPDRAAAKEQVLRALFRTHAHYYDVSSPAIATTR